MRHFSTLLLLMLSLTQTSQAGEVKTYLGLIEPPLPQECTDKGGGTLDDLNTIAYNRVECNGKQILWLEYFIKYDGKKPVWQVIDELFFPQPKKGSEIIDKPSCFIKGEQRTAIFAIGSWVKAKDGSFYGKGITHAWRINLASQKIEVISPKKISCEYENID